MIPNYGYDDLKDDFETAGEQTSYTYKMEIEKKRVVDHTDEIEAVKQAIYKILNTERYQHLIYSWNYGVELADLFGKPIPYAIPEIKRRIIEALTQDDRITGVDAFSFSSIRGVVHATFTVHTVYGDVEAAKEVKLSYV